jgi:arginine decarboxylase-like protein
MGFIDVGGGLGVDYNGTKGWGGHMSTNYSMQNYANDVVAVGGLYSCCMQCDPQRVNGACFQPLNLKCDILVSTFACK